METASERLRAIYEEYVKSLEWAVIRDMGLVKQFNCGAAMSALRCMVIVGVIDGEAAVAEMERIKRIVERGKAHEEASAAAAATV